MSVPIRVRGCRSFVMAMVLLLLATPPGHAVASVTRVLGLGGSNDYMVDDSNVRRWYADLTRWGRQVSLEPGVFDLQAGGDAWADRATGRGAELLLPLDTAGRYGSIAFYLDNDLPDREPGGGIGFAYGRSFGALAGALSFVGTSYADWHGGTSEQLQGRGNYFHELGLGLRWAVSDSVAAEFAGEVVNTQFSVLDEQLRQWITAPSTWRSFGLRARLRMRAAEAMTVVPVIDYWRDLRATYAEVLPSAAQRDAWQTRAGVGVKYAPTAGRLFVFSGEYRKGTEDFTSSGYQVHYGSSAREYFSLHCRFAAEWQMRPWLRARISAEYRRVEDRFLRVRTYQWDYYWDNTRGGSVRAETPLCTGCTLTSGGMALDLAATSGTPSSARFLRNETPFKDDARLLAATLRYSF